MSNPHDGPALAAEVDRLRAELDEERDISDELRDGLQRSCAAIDSFGYSSDDYGGPHLSDCIKQLGADRDTWRQRAERAEAELEVFGEVAAERERQNTKWGEQNHPSVDQVLARRPGGCSPERMCEEYEVPTEERAKFMCQTAAKRGQCTFAHIAVEELCEAIGAANDAERRTEVIQLAAVCIQWVEAIDRAATADTGSGG